MERRKLKQEEQVDSYDYYSGKLRINEHDLNTTIREHPEYLYHVGKECALAVSRRDGLKDEMKRAMANVLLKAKNGVEKCTDTQANAKVDLDREVIAARKAYMDACLESDLWAELKDAFLQRGYALKDLCNMYLANYYSETSVKGPQSGAARDIEYEENRRTIAAGRAARRV